VIEGDERGALSAAFGEQGLEVAQAVGPKDDGLAVQESVFRRQGANSLGDSRKPIREVRAVPRPEFYALPPACGRGSDSCRASPHATRSTRMAVWPQGSAGQGERSRPAGSERGGLVRCATTFPGFLSAKPAAGVWRLPRRRRG
jgi:hypothetical protein